MARSPRARHAGRREVPQSGTSVAYMAGSKNLYSSTKSLVGTDVLVDGGQRFGQPVLAAADVALAGVVGAVGQPDLQVARPGLVHHLDAGEVMVDGLLRTRLVGVGEAAELVVVVLEGVGVDGAQPNPEVAGVARRAPRSRRRCPTECGRATAGASPVSRCTVAASASFSSMVRGVPGVPNTLKRVPEFPNAQEGSSMARLSSEGVHRGVLGLRCRELVPGALTGAP